MMTTSSISDNASSSSPKSNDGVVEMIAVKARPVQNPGNIISEHPTELTARFIDMSSTLRSPPTAAIQEELQLRQCNGQQTITQEIHVKNSDQWMMTSGTGAIHRKSFNIDALLAKTCSQEKDRFANSPDSANECYNEDRRDFTPSPDGNNFRWVHIFQD